MSGVDPSQSDYVDGDEVVYRRVPSEPPFHTPKDWLSTANFDLDSRRNELGISVYRSNYRSVEEVLAAPDALPGSFIVSAMVREIRNLKNGNGEPLQLDVILADEDGANPGHAEIRTPVPGRLSRAARKALRDLFAKSRTET